MTFSTTRLTAFAAATLLTLSLAVPPAFAQATVGPAGGVPSNTAPSNQEGTPAGGTGTLGTTRVGPSGDTSVSNPPNMAPIATRPATRGRYHHRTRHHRHYRHHVATPQTDTQSQPN